APAVLSVTSTTSMPPRSRASAASAARLALVWRMMAMTPVCLIRERTASLPAGAGEPVSGAPAWLEGTGGTRETCGVVIDASLLFNQYGNLRCGLPRIAGRHAPSCHISDRI